MRSALIGLLAVLILPSFALANDRHRGGGSGFSVSVGVGARDSWGSRRDGGYVDASFRYTNRNYNYNHDRNYNSSHRSGYYHQSFRSNFYRPAPVYIHPGPIYRPAPVYCPPPVHYYRPSVRYYGSYRSSGWGWR